MNTKSKKHWYDKPLKFLYFLAVFFPCFLFLGNYITCQIAYQEQTTINYFYDSNGNLTWEYKVPTDTGEFSTNVFYPYDYLNNGYDTPIANAIAFTNLMFLGKEYNEMLDDSLADNDIETYIYPPFINDLYKTLMQKHLLTNRGTDSYALKNAMFRIDLLVFNIIFFEIYITCVFIFLKVLLFLPNVIIYIMDWVERRLNV